MAIASVYGDLLRVPAVRRQTLSSVVAQVTQTVAVGIALVVHGATGSLAAGGVAAAAFALGVCVGPSRSRDGRSTGAAYGPCSSAAPWGTPLRCARWRSRHRRYRPGPGRAGAAVRTLSAA